jgi:type IV pilus assembly protein PilM
LAKKNVLLGVDIGSHSVKVVEMCLRKGMPVITGANLVEFKSDVLQERQASIMEAVSKFKKKQSCLGVSGRSVCVRYIPLTIASETELVKSLVFEADKYIPFEVDEVYIDGQNITPYPETDTAEEIRVLLACVKKETLNVVTSNAISCGLVPEIIDVEAFALGNALEAQRIAEGIPASTVTALVDMGALKTTVNIVKNGISHFSREIYVGGGDMITGIETRLGIDEVMARQLLLEPGPDEEQIDDIVSSVFEEIGSETKMAIDFFENQYEGEIVSEVLVSGGGGLTRKVIELLSVTLDKKTLRWDPFAKFQIENVDLESLGEHRTQFAVAVGLASRVIGG